MPSKTPRFFSALHDTVFVKTAHGRAEVAQRSTRLNGRQRSLLIMLDGRKRLGAIGNALSEPEVAAIIEVLLKFELIAAQAGAAASATAPPAAAGRSPAFAPNPPADPARLKHIKSLMTRSAESCLGLMAADIVRRIEQAADETQLRSVLGHWHMAMRESKYGKHVAGLHLEQIMAGLRGGDMPVLPAR